MAAGDSQRRRRRAQTAPSAVIDLDRAGNQDHSYGPVRQRSPLLALLFVVSDVRLSQVSARLSWVDDGLSAGTAQHEKRRLQLNAIKLEHNALYLL